MMEQHQTIVASKPWVRLRSKMGRAGTPKHSSLKVALLHDWLITHRGGESVLIEIARLFPDAPIFTLVADRQKLPQALSHRQIHTSWLQQLPNATSDFRRALPLFWQACSRWPLQQYDLLLSTSHCVAHSVALLPHQQHLAYIHTPMRYLWDEMAAYLPPSFQSGLGFQAAQLAVWPFRQWDRYVGARPTQLVANSRFVAQRIATCWQRRAHVLYPPVDVAYFADIGRAARPEGFVVVAALVPYKRIDRAIAFANRCNVPLTLVGQGSEQSKLQAMAGHQVKFIPHLPAEQLRALYARSQLFLHCGREDFGIAPVEAMAAGCPVLALQGGGLEETVCTHGERQTGRLFPTLDLEAMDRAWQALQQAQSQGHLTKSKMFAHVQQFDRDCFRAGYQQLLDKMVGDRSYAASL